MNLQTKILNEFLKLRYNLGLGKKTLDLTGRVLQLNVIFTSFSRWTQFFEITNNEPYPNTEVLFKASMVRIDEKTNTLKIDCWETVNNSYKYLSGRITTLGKFELSYGLWVIEAKLCDSFPAIWLLKKQRNIKGYNRVQITPEIDIAENIKGKVRHTVHYGYLEEGQGYARTSYGSSIFENDNRWHEYAVDCRKDGYDFYIDGILTCRMRTPDREFVSPDPHYLIINNAANEWSKSKETTFSIRSVKVFK